VRRLICTFAMIAALCMLGCCDDDCVCPQPEPEHIPDYHFLYSYVGDGYDDYVMTYSTKSGEAIDSTLYDGPPFDNMVFSHDGRYACYTSNYSLRIGNSETWVTNWPSGDTVAYLEGTGALAAYLTLDDQYLLLTGGGIVALLNFPSLTTVFRDSVSRLRDNPDWQGRASWGAALHPSKKLIYVMLEPYGDSIFVFDYSQSPSTITSHQLIDSQGQVRHSYGPSACTADYLVILFSGYLGLFDPVTFTVIRDRTLQPHLLHGAILHPDGHRLFLFYNGGFDWPYGGVDIYDLETGIFQTYIAEGEIDYGLGGINPSELQFTPDGNVMYMSNGGIGFENGPILEIEVSTKEVTRRWDHETGITRIMRLNPKDWAE
jgi:hypothetical protein